MAQDPHHDIEEFDDDELVRHARELVEDLDRTNGWATDERSRRKQDGPVGEPVESTPDDLAAPGSSSEKND